MLALQQRQHVVGQLHGAFGGFAGQAAFFRFHGSPHVFRRAFGVFPHPDAELLEALRAKSACRQVADAVQGHEIPRVDGQAHKRDDVADFLAVVEAGAAHDAIRDASLDQGLFEHAAEGVHAVKDGDVAVMIRRGEADDLPRQRFGLRFFVAQIPDADFLPFFPVCAQVFLATVFVVPDQLIRGVEDHGGGTVVLLQQRYPGVGEIALEVHDRGVIRAAPAVDGLVGVAHDHQVVRTADEQPHHLILRAVDVLIFVDEHPLQALPLPLEQFGIAFQQGQRHRDQVVEIERALLPERLRVFFVHVAHEVVVGGKLHRSGVGGRFDLRDPVQRPRGREFLGVDVQFLHDVFDGRQGIGTVVDHEAGVVAPVAQQLAVAEKQVQTVGVKRADLGAAQRSAQQFFDAFAHFPRRLVGKSHRQHAPRFDVLRGDQPGDLTRQHAGLAASRPGQHELRRAREGHGFALSLVQAF